MSVVLLVYVQRHYFIPYEWGRVTRALGIALLLWAVQAYAFDFFDRSTTANLVRFVLLASYPVLLFITRFFDADELREMRRIISRNTART